MANLVDDLVLDWTKAFDVSVSLTGIPSAEAFGVPVLVPGAVLLFPSGIPTLEVFGVPHLLWNQPVLPGGIPSGEVFGTPGVHTFRLAHTDLIVEILVSPDRSISVSMRDPVVTIFEKDAAIKINS